MQSGRDAAPPASRPEESMSANDPALMTAEEMLGAYARRALSPVEVLQAVTERVARLNRHVQRVRGA